LVHLSVRAWLYARKLLVGMACVLAKALASWLGFHGINPMKVPTQQHTNACWFQPIGNWNKQLV
ncbi:hypothetical protein MHBAU10_14050, partial (plasmid) [Staphylococcus aureus]